jgi:hypothetical protein
MYYLGFPLIRWIYIKNIIYMEGRYIKNFTEYLIESEGGPQLQSTSTPVKTIGSGSDDPWLVNLYKKTTGSDKDKECYIELSKENVIIKFGGISYTFDINPDKVKFNAGYGGTSIPESDFEKIKKTKFNITRVDINTENEKRFISGGFEGDTIDKQNGKLFIFTDTETSAPNLPMNIGLTLIRTKNESGKDQLKWKIGYIK